MTVASDSLPLLASLERLIERLSAPDLTLAEADAIRPRISGLLETLQTASATRVDPSCR